MEPKIVTKRKTYQLMEPRYIELRGSIGKQWQLARSSLPGQTQRRRAANLPKSSQQLMNLTSQTTKQKEATSEMIESAAGKYAKAIFVNRLILTLKRNAGLIQSSSILFIICRGLACRPRQYDFQGSKEPVIIQLKLFISLKSTVEFSREQYYNKGNNRNARLK